MGLALDLSLNFQDSNSPLIEELSQLHDFINLILVFIITFVGVIIIIMSIGKHINLGSRNANSRVGVNYYSCGFIITNCPTFSAVTIYVRRVSRLFTNFKNYRTPVILKV